MFNIAIAGTGYEGLVVGVCFAEVGHHVTCVDIDEAKIKMLKENESPIYEADLARLMKKNYARDRLDYLTDEEAAYKNADVIFIDVGVPENPDGSVDLSYITSLTEKIASIVAKDCLIVIKTTVPVGTCDKLDQIVAEFSVNSYRVEIAYNPEFFAKGTAIRDTLQVPGIVIGTESEWAEEILRRVYEPFKSPILRVSRKSAEMMKYASNSFLALKISYMNDIANLCERMGADIKEVSQGLAFDKRIGLQFLGAGIGYGGPNISKDTKTLSYMANLNGYELRTVKAAIDVNNDQKDKLYQKAFDRVKSFKGLKVAILGLTYKPGTDDCRESPAVYYIPKLLQEGASIFAYDPVGQANFRKLFPEGEHGNGITYTDHIEDAIDDADVCFILTEWGKIKMMDPVLFRIFMRTPIVYDGRNVYELEAMRKAEVEYYSIGREAVNSFRYNIALSTDRISQSIEVSA
ncbi:UDP-glucose/GDP-mannose dehydrogenase family protein [Mobilitalea sibirica]|uniref:UDP-glucose 6-dehydrogenase n=1 Tax=Mobilitalea sibirica TaxID=1462919 RepID=A0A8J7HAY4_9FIRM|nr:UDP-glucose/GDP-mannose dehydrogenase family protein [Mobilitalea sibirica]MBH1939382.1 UDP-glucose/GDP-mannose dehydrogenase family protein [Mobilitalea sibirica]